MDIVCTMVCINSILFQCYFNYNNYIIYCQYRYSFKYIKQIIENTEELDIAYETRKNDN